MTIKKSLSNREHLLESMRTLSAELDYQTVLQSVISVASKLTNSEVASILKYEEADGHLHFLAAPWFQKDSMQSLRVPVDESIAGWVYQHAEPLVIQDVKEDKRFYSEVDQAVKFQTNSILAIPLLVQGRCVGVLEAINKVNRAHYNGEDVIILETLASQAALILENMDLEQRVTQMQAATDRLEQMKKDFIAIASHELRTPLGLIIGHSTFLREVIEEEHHEQLDTIISSGAKLKEIIENLSNVQNFQSGAASIRMKKFSLPNLIKENIDAFQEKAKDKKVSFHTDIKHPDLLLEGDAEKIGIALGNLLKNAVSFTSEGGHVFIIMEQIPGYAKVAIIDDGIGITAKELPHIFERFYQVESHLTRQHGGMGLGLSVAKVMIELHGGKIWAESILGKGSQFAFLLPLDRDQFNAAERVFQH
ncbi:MAG: GAF domain-containing protein [Anaerolineae bacterium]|jgi:signal transduction histidine kinase|nr:GAF domain-containing protein [Anaerolineae bacterium]MBT7188594.1 GAF domain-containing protein [Anaerolineae bacterium]MBT7989955.1 GAF domain-containing protein [Anaerolineae bacterium]